MANTVNNQPVAVSPQPGDFLLAYQPGQTPPTRKITMANAAVAGIGKAIALSSDYSTGSAPQLSMHFTIDVPLASDIVNDTINRVDVDASVAGHQLWCNFDEVIYDVPGGDPSSGGSVIARTMQTVRQTASVNTAIGAAIATVSDQTGLKSSLSGGILALRAVISANDDDDAASRGVVTAFLQKENSGGATAQANYAFGAFTGTDVLSNFLSIFQGGAPFKNAVLDCRFAITIAGGTSHAVWLKTGLDVAFSNSGADALSGDGTLISSTVPLRPTPLLVANLPVFAGAKVGAMAYAVNGRNNGEGAAAGTGCLVTLNSAGVWQAVWSGVAVTA